MKHLKLFKVFVCLMFTWGLTLSAGARATEAFPETVEIQWKDAPIKLVKTGESLREFLFFDIYRIALYVEGLVEFPSSYGELLSPNFTKQLHLVYQRDISAEKVKDVLLSGLESNVTSEELEQLQPQISLFFSKLTKDIEEGDELVIRSFTGGELVFIANGNEMHKETNVLFNRAFLSIWLGEHSVIKRSELIRFP